jgi:hypothetical protein
MPTPLHALLPLLGTTAGSSRSTRSVPRNARTGALAKGARVARTAVPLRHHAVASLADELEIRFHPSGPAVYVHEGARQALERRIAAVARVPVAVSITDNRHSMIHASRKHGLLRVRVHHMFLDAPPSVVDALARFILFHDRDASAAVGRFIDDHGTRIRTPDPLRRTLRQRGTHHDLQEIFDEVNARYFGGEVDARISWGRETAAGRRLTTIKLGSYTALERLIRVHPRLDRRFVPRYFIAYVVFHEMLHHVMPATRENGRRSLHPPEFRERERAFRHYDRALAWEEANVGRVLR